ncbi:MAG: helix-turn-helix domain-containing protein [Candidatus Aminicenantes bacterium]|nr:MAG: helix-turn-helix domain-containing protein [Candidatus Aminicenantes bacterium]
MVRIVGTKIRKLREEMGLTQEDLAKSVGLSSEFISLLELGRRSPSLESLSRIAKFLDKEISFFILEKTESFDSLIQGDKLDAKTKRLLRKFRSDCEDYLQIEEMTGRQSDLAPLYANVIAEKLAEQERNRLDLGNDPIPNVFSLLELSGLHIIRRPIHEDIHIAGVFLFLEHKQAAFALINSNQPFHQQILTATHEYAHYLKDRYDGPIIDNPDIFIEDYITLYHGREKYAQTFALHFLLPPEKLKDFIDKDLRSKHLGVDDILYIRRHYDVSLLALIQMLKKIEYISLSQFKECQKWDWEQYETALFGSRKISAPQKARGHSLLSARFVSLVSDAYRLKKISAEKAAHLLRISKEKFLSFPLR